MQAIESQTKNIRHELNNSLQAMLFQASFIRQEILDCQSIDLSEALSLCEQIEEFHEAYELLRSYLER